MSLLFGTVAGDGVTVAVATGSTVPSWVNGDGTEQVNSFGGVIANNGVAASPAPTSSSFTLTTGVTPGSYQFVIAKLWAAGQGNMWWQNLDPTHRPPTSSTQTAIGKNGGASGVGYFGSDGGQSIDLRPTNSGLSALWVTQDTSMSGSGQTRVGTQFAHNTFIFQSGGLDLSTSSNRCITDYTVAAGHEGFIVTKADGSWFYPAGGIATSSGILVFGFVHSGSSSKFGPGTAVYWGSPAGSGGFQNHANWLRIPSPFFDSWPIPSDWRLGTDGYVYATCLQTNGTLSGKGVYMCRFPLADLEQAPPSLAGVQWWCGTQGWVGGPAYGNPPLLSRIVPINTELGWTACFAFMQRSDGTWNRAACPSLSVGGPIIAWASLPEATTPFLESQSVVVYNPPAQGALGVPQSYYAAFHPAQTWAGKQTDDVLMGFSTIVGSYSDTRTYWPYLIQVTGL